MLRRNWWDHWLFVAAIAALSVVPLLLPSAPPLVDVPGHIGRFRVELDLQSSRYLPRYFEFQWHLIGNLGTDLLVVPLSKVLGLELAVKLIIMAIPALTTIGFVLVSRQMHGALQPTALFAIPFVYGYPFNYGFINFSLSIAFALLAFVLWNQLSRADEFRLRAALFVPVSCVVWLIHIFGWGVLGLLSWSTELIRLRDKGQTLARAAFGASVSCLPQALPVGLMLFWRSGTVAGETGGYFQVASKLLSILSAVRDRWLLWDSFAVAVALVLIGSAIMDRHLAFSRRLTIPAIVLGIFFILMPGQIFGSAYADMRLVPLMLAIALLALRVCEDSRLEHRLAWLGLAFLLMRLGGNTLSFYISDQDAKRTLAALDLVPRGSAVLSLVGGDCAQDWAMPRHSHLGSYVITRREGFSNDQWQLAGAQLLRVKYLSAGEFKADPSEVTYSVASQKKIIASGQAAGFEDVEANVHRHWRTADESLDQFPRSAFDYVWIIRPEGLVRRSRPDLKLIWRSSNSMLFQVIRQPTSRSEPARS